MQVSTSGSGLLYVDEPATDASSFAVDQFSSSFSGGSPSSDDQLYVVAANAQPRRQQRFVIASPSSFLSPSSSSAAAGGQHSPPQPPHCDASVIEVSPSTSTSSSTSALRQRAETDDFAVLKPEIDFADVAAAVTTSAYPLSDSQLPNRLHVSTPAGVDATASCRGGGFPLPVSYGGVENQLLHVSMETGTCDTAAADCIQWNLSAAERRRTEHLSSTPCASAGPSSGSRHSDIDSFFMRYIY